MEKHPLGEEFDRITTPRAIRALARWLLRRFKWHFRSEREAMDFVIELILVEARRLGRQEQAQRPLDSITTCVFREAIRRMAG